MGHPAGRQRRVRVAQGGCARRLSAPLRPGPPRGLSGRDQPARTRRDAAAGSGGAGTTGPLRSRVHPRWGGQSVSGLRAGAWRAPRPGQRAADPPRRGGVRPGPRRPPLPRRRAHRIGDGSPRTTHSPASRSEAFAPAEAKRLADKLEIHHTPKHGSWLNMAEIELSALQRQWLDRRLGDRATMASEVTAWVTARNGADATVDWRFTTADARIKLKRLYPAYQT
jgi:hypothetical protein